MIDEDVAKLIEVNRKQSMAHLIRLEVDMSSLKDSLQALIEDVKLLKSLLNDNDQTNGSDQKHSPTKSSKKYAQSKRIS